ncbi:uncharacterized protein LOC114332832 [Diabrotica virgifera virgifera]|uniref:Uncharacterized protein LOC114332832 n=1 Tax=Diabrotica virgifera virgifera TaxID=50390 RepID=A0A6P7FQ06_DIAVI|nr:uncharacterized protein LOC114332832 [Diabrotica virgifera virgifera]
MENKDTAETALASEAENPFSLESYFKDIIAGKQIETDVNKLQEILEKSIGLSFHNMNPKLKFILPYILVHYIKIWPGWKKTSEYHQQQISFESWYLKFKEYLIYKINFMIKNDYEKGLAMVRYNATVLEEREVSKCDNSTQTSSNADKTTAPFTIEISGPARVLNSVIFCEGEEDTVFVKEYQVPIAWGDQLNIRQLTNWPFVEVNFVSEYLHFKRTNKHQFIRCLTFSTERITFKKSDSFVEEINIIDEHSTRQAYTLNAVREYCSAYISTLKKRNDILNWTGTSFDEVKVIIEDFILDIFALGFNSIATNTSVLYNIGNSVYARNKCIKTSDQSICFGECLTPKLCLSLHAFTAIKDANITSFDDLFLNNDTLLPSITFRCTFCNVSYNNTKDLWNHLKGGHVMEQPVLCIKCKLQIKIEKLTDNRWYHQCSKKVDKLKTSGSLSENKSDI